jgi:deoxycytidine triphosphate deaminase
MLMTDGEIKEALASGELIIEQYDEKQLQPCSYDGRAGEQVLVSGNDNLIDLSKQNSVTLRPGDFALIMTYESFRLPLNRAAHIGMKSGLARRGLILLAGMQIDPGFEGHLRLALYNCGQRSITIDYLDSICLIEFHRLSKPAEKGIREFTELKEGHIPDDDKAYLRQLETTSLSDLARDMRSLTQNMAILTNNVENVSNNVKYGFYMGATILATIVAAIIIQLIFHYK